MIKNSHLALVKVRQAFSPRGDLDGKHQSIYWNLWADVDESVGIDYCNGVINPFRTRCFIDTVKDVEATSSLMLVSDLGDGPTSEHNIYYIDKDVHRFLWFQKEGFLKSGLTTKFYVFDISARWLMHIDESVLFSADAEIIDSLVSKLGGRNKVIEDMRTDLAFCAGFAREWRQSILNSFAQRQG